MDYYEVLGIRRNASSHEIEMAYKGRRTQYHPDRYHGSDAETLAWATAKMQEINAAYTVLSDDTERAEFDSTLNQRATKAEAPAQQEAASHQEERPSLRSLLQHRLSPFAGFERIYFAPRMPEKKLQAAVSNYGAGTKPSEVLAMVNTTVFGGGREGILLTEEGLRAKELTSEPWQGQWSEVRELDLRGTSVRINGFEIADCTMVDKGELNRLFTVVKEFVGLVQAGRSNSSRTAQRGETDTPWADPQLCDQMYQQAIAALVAASDALVQVEETIGETLLDRDQALRFMKSIEEGMPQPQKSRLAFKYLEDIALISVAIVAVLDRSVTQVPEDLIRRRLTEPVFMQEFRALLRRLL